MILCHYVIKDGLSRQTAIIIPSSPDDHSTLGTAEIEGSPLKTLVYEVSVSIDTTVDFTAFKYYVYTL